MKKVSFFVAIILIASLLSGCITITFPGSPTPEPTATPEPTLNPYAAIDAKSLASECDNIVAMIGADDYYCGLSGTTYLVTVFMPGNTAWTVDAYLNPSTVDEETYAEAKDLLEQLVDVSERMSMKLQEIFDENDHSEVDVMFSLYARDDYEDCVFLWADRETVITIFD